MRMARITDKVEIIEVSGYREEFELHGSDEVPIDDGEFESCQGSRLYYLDNNCGYRYENKAFEALYGIPILDDVYIVRLKNVPVGTRYSDVTDAQVDLTDDDVKKLLEKNSELRQLCR